MAAVLEQANPMANGWKSLQKCQNEKDSISQQLPQATVAFCKSSTCTNFLYKTYQENKLFPIKNIEQDSNLARLMLSSLYSKE
jgi:hypothetical protein